MPRISFSWSPDHHSSNNADDIDVELMDATVDYFIDVPENTEITIDAIYAHVNKWLRGCGFYIEDE